MHVVVSRSWSCIAQSVLHSPSIAAVGIPRRAPLVRCSLTRHLSTRVSVDEAKRLFKEAKCVAFDVDSTVSTEEGIDVLAEAFGKGEEVAAWTRKAMGGSVTFQEAIRSRLDLINPTQQGLEALIKKHDFPLTPGMSELFAELKGQGKEVILISGGLRQMIEPIARQLDIPDTDIYAIKLFFNPDGSFKDYDQKAYTARSGGKAACIKFLANARSDEPGLRDSNRPIVMIGDGITDMEADEQADAVIGFGGNVVRDSVKERAQWYVHSTDELLSVLRS